MKNDHKTYKRMIISSVKHNKLYVSVLNGMATNNSGYGFIFQMFDLQTIIKELSKNNKYNIAPLTTIYRPLTVYRNSGL